jgi:CNT family concentrative nucleoside transporter
MPHDVETPIWLRIVSLGGLAVMIGLAWALSYDRKAFPWRIVLYGTGLQLVFGVLVLRTSAGLWFFSVLNDAVMHLLEFTDQGSRFLFGDYLDEHFSVALNVLPTIIFFSALMTVLYHFGLMQRVVKAVAWVMQRTLKTSGAETLSTAANIFVGQTEAPLVVKPYVADMTESELLCIMVGGFATVAGGVLAAYVGMLRPHFPDIAGHLIAASVLAAPATIVMSKVVLPEKSTPRTAGTLELDATSPYANVIDAAATGAAEGLKLALNVGAMLVAFIALVALVNWVFALPSLLHNQAEWQAMLASIESHGLTVPEGCPTDGAGDLDAGALAACIDRGNALDLGRVFSAWQPTTMQWLLGWLGWPIAFAMGIPPEDCAAASALLGERVVLNEFVAYLHLAENLDGAHPVGMRSATILSYALCGFANFGSIAIQVGGIGGMAPERRQDLARLGMRAMIAGLLASYMTACVAGLLA